MRRVRAKVAAGEYATESEVIRDGLRALLARDKAVEKASDARCEKYFARYVGIDWDSSAYNYDYATPDRSEWRYGNRLVICMADDPNHPKGNRISLRKVKE